MSLVVDEDGIKAVFGDINGAAMDTHGFTSDRIIRIEAGDVTRSILHSDEGFGSQLTYEDKGRQKTDSLEASWVQEKLSSPALYLSSYSIPKAINNIYS